MLKLLLSIFFGYLKAGTFYTGKCGISSVLYLFILYILLAGFFAGAYVIAKNNIDVYYYNESTLLYKQLAKDTSEFKPDNMLALYDGLCELQDKRVFYTSWCIGLLLAVFLTAAGNVWLADIANSLFAFAGCRHQSVSKCSGRDDETAAQSAAKPQL